MTSARRSSAPGVASGPLVPCDPPGRGPAAGQPATPGGRAVVGARLSVAKLAAMPAGADHGPLKPRLPERLRTPEQRIDLLPAIVADALPDVLGPCRPSRASPREAPAHRAAAPARQQLLAAQRLAPDPRPGSARADAHPDDLAVRGIRHGRRSRAVGGGEVRVEVAATEDLMPGVVSLPHGYRHARDGVRLRPRHRLPGVSVNDLTDPDVVEPVSGNAVLNGVPVTVEPLAVAVGEEALAGGRSTRPSRSRSRRVVTPDDARPSRSRLPDVVERPTTASRPDRRGGASSRRCRPRTSCG